MRAGAGLGSGGVPGRLRPQGAVPAGRVTWPRKRWRGRWRAGRSPPASRLPAARDGPVRVWVPVVEQTTRTGVLAVTCPARRSRGGPGAGRAAGRVRRAGRGVGRAGQRRPLRAAAGPGHVAAGGHAVGPAAAAERPHRRGADRRGARAGYDIAGDAFDYAVNGADLHFAIIDGLGHGIGSTLLTGLAVGAYRHARRDGAPVAGMHAASTRRWPGTMTIVVRHRHHRPAGHRARDGWSGRVPGIRGRCCCAAARWSPSSTATRRCRSGSAMHPGRASASWSPDDAVLLYTDGVIGGADPGRGVVRAGTAGRPAGAGGRQRPAGRGTAAPAGPGRAGAPGWRPAR